MYHALYRKYRPKDFDDVVGQDSIIKTLQNSILHNNFSHAYMFFGPRGTGKTSVSKIFARNVNCLNSHDGLACGKCSNCLVSFSKECVDIIEIDAASNNGVDEIRELKNKISLVPSDLKFKVYIIDEVHMLSIGAFNALLKTLEEPPEHVIFILATTDPQKVPDTIVSRCQCFNFKKISTDIIHRKLLKICDFEKIDIEDDVLYSISLYCDGGLRDALGLLDKLSSFSNSKITMNDFIDVNGILHDNDIELLLENFFNGNVKYILENIALYDSVGKNLIQIMEQILNFCRNNIIDFYFKDSCLYDINKLLEFTSSLNDNILKFKTSSNVRISIELFFLKLINKKNLTNTVIDNDSSKNISILSDTSVSVNEKTDNSLNNSSIENNSLNNNEFSGFLSNKVKIVKNISQIMDVRVNNTFSSASKKNLSEEVSKFELFKKYTFDQEYGFLACTLLDSKVRAASDKNLIISFEYESNVTQNRFNIDKLTNFYKFVTGSEKKIAIISDTEWDKYRNDYIVNLKNGIKYNYIDEPEEIFEEYDKSDIISSKALSLFGDAVEIE